MNSWLNVVKIACYFWFSWGRKGRQENQTLPLCPGGFLSNRGEQWLQMWDKFYEKPSSSSHLCVPMRTQLQIIALPAAGRWSNKETSGAVGGQQTSRERGWELARGRSHAYGKERTRAVMETVGDLGGFNFLPYGIFPYFLVSTLCAHPYP